MNRETVSTLKHKIEKQIKAANPGTYRYQAVKPPAYDSTPGCLDASYELKRLVFSTCPAP
jgi:hypothetical protein